MSALQILRQSKHIARWVLVWFALSLTVAVAAPVVNPQGLTLVCTAAGQVKLVNADSQPGSASQNGSAAVASVHQQLDCVLCLALDVPPISQTTLSAHFPSIGSVEPCHSDPLALRLFAHNVSARGPPAVVRSLSV